MILKFTDPRRQPGAATTLWRPQPNTPLNPAPFDGRAEQAHDAVTQNTSLTQKPKHCSRAAWRIAVRVSRPMTWFQLMKPLRSPEPPGSRSTRGSTRDDASVLPRRSVASECPSGSSNQTTGPSCRSCLLPWVLPTAGRCLPSWKRRRAPWEVRRRVSRLNKAERSASSKLRATRAIDAQT
jgi:hypothetical protein